MVSGIICLTAVCILQPDMEYFRWISTQTVQILLACLFLGVCFLLLKSRLLSFVAFGACTFLCLFLKNASNLSLKVIPQNGNDGLISLLHCTMSEIQGESTFDFSSLLKLDNDIIVFQEYTPQWKQIILPEFDSVYQYKYEFLRLDNYGQLIVSKYPIVMRDTMEFNGVPIANITVALSEEKNINIIGHYNLPPLTEDYRSTSKKVFSELSNYIRQQKIPTLYVGTINYAPWDNEMVKFRYSGFLNDSRKGFFPTLYGAGTSFFDYPVDHIFYNEYLECLAFKKVENANNQRIAIRGQYQLKSRESLVDLSQDD
ncbi:endonuclease/exonuclease/phosphatase family protein [Membranihabitans marinus]|uniref:endonuclease/exonuclease/phosphatase family protein n=1 Tax=Membranihabitans marinus TaxID=1227546 RepID=UPI001F1EC8ED|nr:endonuclease/exonuclease/phosphatase family protein [Membranihabitans marinus]